MENHPNNESTLDEVIYLLEYHDYDWSALLRLWLCLDAKDPYSIKSAIRTIERLCFNGDNLLLGAKDPYSIKSALRKIERLRFDGFKLLLNYLDAFADDPRDDSLHPSQVLFDLLDNRERLVLNFCMHYPKVLAGCHLQGLAPAQQHEQAKIAIQSGFSARTIATELGDQPLFAAISIPLSIALESFGDKDRSLEVAREAVRICRDQLPFRFEIHGIQLARALGNLSSRTENGGNLSEAIELARESIDFYLKLDNISPGKYNEELAEAFYTWGIKLSFLGLYEESLIGLTESACRFRKLAADHPLIHSSRLASVLVYTIMILVNIKLLDKAIQVIDELGDIWKKLPCTSRDLVSWQLGESLLIHSDILGKKGQLIKSTTMAQRAFELLGACPELKPRELLLKKVKHLTNHSKRLQGAGLAGEALKTAREAVTIMQDLVEEDLSKNYSAIADALSLLSMIFDELRQFDESLATGRQSVRLARKAYALDSNKHAGLLATSLRILSSSLAYTDLPQAIEINEEALKLRYSQFDDDPDSNFMELAVLLCNNASLLNSAGRKRSATASARLALEVLTNFDTEVLLPIFAQAHLEYAISLTGTFNDDEVLASIQFAIDTYLSLETLNPNTFRYHLATAMNTKGMILRNLGLHREALPFLRRSLEFWDQIIDLNPAMYARERSITYALHGSTLLMCGETSENEALALQHLRISVRLAEITREGYLMRGDRDTAQYRNLKCYTDLIAALLLIYRRTKDTDLFVEAVETIEKSRARGLLEEIEGLSIPEEWDSDMILEFRRIRNELLALGAASDLCMSHRDSHAAASSMRLGPRAPKHHLEFEKLRNQKIAHFVHQLEEIQRKIQLTYPEWVPDTMPQPAIFAELASAIPTDKRTVFVTFAMLPDETVAFIVTASGFVDMIRFDSISVEYHEFHHAEWMNHYHGVNSSGSNTGWNRSRWMSFLPSLLTTISKDLVSPLWNRLSEFPDHRAENAIQRVIFMPHESLRLYPLHACEVGNGGTRLGDLIEVSYTPSGSMLRALNRPIPSHSGEILLFGNPDQNLPFSEWETKKLAQKYSTYAFAGSAATLAAFRQHSKQAKAFSFSGHSSFAPRNPANSGLSLHDGDWLTAGLLAHSRMLPDCLLVFINGCESALLLPSYIDGEISLPTAFLHSGARCVISTLWPVDDLAAALLGVKFHELWDGGHGLSPVSALHQSQRWLRGIGAGSPSSLNILREKILPTILAEENCEAMRAACVTSLKRLETESPDSPPFAHPLYWAGFTLHGVGW